MSKILFYLIWQMTLQLFVRLPNSGPTTEVSRSAAAILVVFKNASTGLCILPILDKWLWLACHITGCWAEGNQTHLPEHIKHELQIHLVQYTACTHSARCCLPHCHLLYYHKVQHIKGFKCVQRQSLYLFSIRTVNYVCHKNMKKTCHF